MGGERSPVSKYTVGAVASMGPGLVRLHLIGFDKMTDQSFAAVISCHPSLEDLSLWYSVRHFESLARRTHSIHLVVALSLDLRPSKP